MVEYIIKGDFGPNHESCLVFVCGPSAATAYTILKRMQTNPTENDKKLTKGASYLWVEQVASNDCWWNFNCD